MSVTLFVNFVKCTKHNSLFESTFLFVYSDDTTEDCTAKQIIEVVEDGESQSYVVLNEIQRTVSAYNQRTGE